jgi:hypothetical protein
VRIVKLAACATVLLTLAWCRLARAQEMPMPQGSASPTGHLQMPEPLLVTLQAVPGYGPAPLLVGFLVNATDPSGAQIVSYTWNFGDGHLSIVPPTLAYNTYANPGSYVATVTVTTIDGRSATGFAGVTVKPAESP